MRFLLALVGVTLMATSVLNLKENIMAWHTELDDPILTPAPVGGGGMTTGTPITEATLPPVRDGGTAPLESLPPVARPTAAPTSLDRRRQLAEADIAARRQGVEADQEARRQGVEADQEARIQGVLADREGRRLGVEGDQERYERRAQERDASRERRAQERAASRERRAQERDASRERHAPTVDVGNDTVALTGNVYRTGDRDAGPNGDIRAAQTALVRLGTSVGEVDGVYGRNTSNAVQDAQELFGLPRTGVLDEATQDALDNLTDDQIAFFTSESEAMAAPTEAPVTYTTQGGDTFSKIASENTFTLDQLKDANPDITDFNNVMVGQEINLPVEGAPVVEAPNTPEQTKEVVIEQLPTEIAENVQQTEGDSPTDINRAIFDGASFSGALPTPEVGDDAITWIADNAYGIEEENPEFRRAMRGLLQGIDPDKQPWCAAFAGHIFRSLGVEVPSLAQQNPNLAWNYQDIGEEVYNHNPTTGRTYAGSLDAVQTGDVIVFNKNPNRQSDGSFGWGKGHISFVVDVEEDGTILAIGGNQQDRVQTSRYSPDTIRRYYEGGFRVRRITTQSLEQTSPEVIASITAGIAAGGAGN